MVGRILSTSYITATYPAGEALEYGQAVYLDGEQVKKVTDGTKPVLGFVARTEHDRTDTIALADTVHVLSAGEITLKTTAGLVLTGLTSYNPATGAIATGAGAKTLYGVAAVSKLADTEAHVRVSGAIGIAS